MHVGNFFFWNPSMGANFHTNGHIFNSFRIIRVFDRLRIAYSYGREKININYR